MHITASDRGKSERHAEMIAAGDTQHLRGGKGGMVGAVGLELTAR
jgi:hypothetical protein